MLAHLSKIQLHEQFLDKLPGVGPELELREEAAHVRVEAETGEEVRPAPLQPHQPRLGHLRLADTGCYNDDTGCYNVDTGCYNVDTGCYNVNAP